MLFSQSSIGRLALRSLVVSALVLLFAPRPPTLASLAAPRSPAVASLHSIGEGERCAASSPRRVAPSLASASTESLPKAARLAAASPTTAASAASAKPSVTVSVATVAGDRLARNVPDALGRCCIEAGGERECVRAGIRVAFRDNVLCERGTTVAVFDYMDAWERLACGVAYASAQDSDDLCPKYGGVSSAPRFRKRFGGRVFVTDRWWSTVDADLKRENVTMLYQIMAGDPAATGTRTQCVRNVVHAVFDGTSPHGDGYALISPLIPKAPGVPAVLHIINQLPEGAGHLRGELGIESDAVVFCRHGAMNTFSIGFVRSALCEFLSASVAGSAARPWFLFLNTEELACADVVASYGRLKYLPGTTDLHSKARFLGTCNACIHGRAGGEANSLVIGECTVSGLPVISHSERGPDGDFHITLLGEHMLGYRNGTQFKERISGFDVAKHRAKKNTYKELYSEAQEESVMISFIRAFRPELPLKC